MADRLEEMDAVLDANVQAGTLTEGLAEVDKNTPGNIFSRVDADALDEILFG